MKGVQYTATIVLSNTNEVRIDLLRYPYVHGILEVSINLVAAGPEVYNPAGYDWAIMDNELYLVHKNERQVRIKIRVV